MGRRQGENDVRIRQAGLPKTDRATRLCLHCRMMRSAAGEGASKASARSGFRNEAHCPRQKIARRANCSGGGLRGSGLPSAQPPVVAGSGMLQPAGESTRMHLASAAAATDAAEAPTASESVARWASATSLSENVGSQAGRPPARPAAAPAATNARGRRRASSSFSRPSDSTCETAGARLGAAG